MLRTPEKGVANALIALAGRTDSTPHLSGIKAPTLILRAPEGLLTPSDCLMTPEEANAMARAISRSKLVVVPGTNHYTVLLGQHRKVKAALRAFLKGT